MAAEILSAADLKAPVAAPAMPPADVEPPWPPALLPPTPTSFTPAPEREATPMPPALPPSEAASSPDQEPKLETSPASPAELTVALMPPQLPPSGPRPVASLHLAPAALPPEAPTEQQEADQVPPAMPSVELQSAPAVAPPEDHSCSSCGHREQGLREGKVPVLAFPPRLLAVQLTQIDVECQVLQNFASLHEILSALWSNSIQQLTQTWKEASRDSICHPGQMRSKTSLKRELPGQGRLINYQIGLKEYKVISRIKCLQEGCSYIYFWHMEEFKAWFWAVDQLIESECYHLSCEREPPALLASNTLNAPNLPDVVKPWSAGPQELSAEPSCSGASLPSVQLQLGRDLSSGVAAVSHPGHEADASQSHLEMSVGLISKCPDGQEKQKRMNISMKKRNLAEGNLSVKKNLP
ncbi:ral guanine nucleotide dissociation stimulator-like isoform X2 [Tamandua tetradactyla]|uniref:ral guanine nucleotide dissociation stimulator-like isoform X2 n=1 Tax=Tamandua tetradactyla TaxID=48850 RepID=UPI0040538613